MPSTADLNAVGQTCEALFIRAWSLHKNNQNVEAERLAHMLVLEPRASKLHQAGCHLILACGTNNYVFHAEKALRLYQDLYHGTTPTPEQAESKQELVEQAERILERARNDEQEIEDEYKQRLTTLKQQPSYDKKIASEATHYDQEYTGAMEAWAAYADEMAVKGKKPAPAAG